MGLPTTLLLLTFALQDDDLKRALPRLAPTEPGDAAKTFRLQKGFRAELLAGEPLVSSPVEMTFDEDGRLWVIEMIDYPYDEREKVPPQGRVKVLEDTDGDGRPDKGTVFADRLGWPTSLVFADGGIFVAVAPHIYFLKDTDGDGSVDRKETVFTGFGHSNVQARMSQLRWGPDHWIYGQNGGNGGMVTSNRKPDLAPVPLNGRDFRFRPTGEFEPLAAGGGRFSNTFDDFGRRFACSTTSPVRHIVLEHRVVGRNPHLPVPALVAAIAAEGGGGPVYPASPPEPWRVALTRMLLRQGTIPGTVASLEQGGRVNGYFTGSTGLTVFRGTALGPAAYGTLFVGECGQNLIHRRMLAPAGSTFRADRLDPLGEFLASTDNWFRPVNFANGPDGALYVCDMYRECIEHPWSIPPAIKAHLDLTSGKERGRLWRITADGAPAYVRPRLGGAKVEELAAALARPDGWWRDTASRLLYERQDKAAIPALEKLLSHERPATRSAALWALEGLGVRRGDALLRDPHPGVRENAVRLADLEPLFALDDPDARVRLELAARMGETDDARAVDVLARLAPGADGWLRLAVAAAARGREAKLLKRLAADEIAYTLALIVGARNDEADVAAALELAGSVPILRGLGEGLSRAGKKLGDLPGAARLFEAAERSALDEREEAGRRVEAARLLAHGPFAAAERVLRPLLGAAPELRRAAVRALAARREPEVGPILLGAWKGLAADDRREALGWFSHPQRLATLVEALEKSRVAPDDLPLDLRKTLLSHKELGARARAVLGDAAATDRAALLRSYRPALTKKGDAARGREVFKTNCAACHRVKGEGHEVGPDLAATKAKTPEELLEAILDPNRLVDPEFLNYKVLTSGGRLLDGVLSAVTPSSVTLKRGQGETETVLRANIESMVSTGVSLMPEGVEKAIDVDRMADLLQFLREP